MATAIFMRDPFDAFAESLQKIAGMTDDIARQALYVGAKIYADAMKDELTGVIKDKRRDALIDAFGITPFKQDRNFNYTVHLGFDGYQTIGDRRVPYQLIARSLNSGAKLSESREIKATHFAQNAVNKNKQRAQAAMRETVERLINEQIGGKA